MTKSRWFTIICCFVGILLVAAVIVMAYYLSSQDEDIKKLRKKVHLKGEIGKYMWERRVLIHEDTAIVQNTTVTKLDIITLGFIITFDVKATTFGTEWMNIIHFTTKGDHGVYGYRHPAVWFHNTKRGYLTFFAAVRSGNGSDPAYYFDSNSSVELGKWNSVEIQQTREKLSYRYKVYLNGKLQHSIINEQPEVFNNVSVYVSDPWFRAQPGFIRNLVVNLKRGCRGEDSGCCTPEAPCFVGEGDCDDDRDCGGSLICGKNNCPWGDGDDCCTTGKVEFAKLDFGQPGVNVQSGFIKLGYRDGGYGTYTGTFPCQRKTCTIVVAGYTHTRGNYFAVTNQYSYLSNLLRSSFLRSSHGTLTVEIRGLNPLTQYQIKTYHHSTYKSVGGSEFTLKYDGNQLNRLKESVYGDKPNPPLNHTEIVTSNGGGRISLVMQCLTENLHMDLNGMEIWQLG